MQDSIPEAIALVGACAPELLYHVGSSQPHGLQVRRRDLANTPGAHGGLTGSPLSRASRTYRGGRRLLSSPYVEGVPTASVAQAVAAGAADIVVVADGFAERGDEEGAPSPVSARHCRGIGPTYRTCWVPVGYADFSPAALPHHRTRPGWCQVRPGEPRSAKAVPCSPR